MLARAEHDLPAPPRARLAGQRANQAADRSTASSPGRGRRPARPRHARSGPARALPRATDDLLPEERRIYEVAARWYVAQFGDRADGDSPTRDDEIETVAPRHRGATRRAAGLALEDADRRARAPAPLTRQPRHRGGPRRALGARSRCCGGRGGHARTAADRPRRPARRLGPGGRRRRRADLGRAAGCGSRIASRSYATATADPRAGWRADIGWECRAVCRYIAGCQALR